ncbi:transposase [Roseimicrobium sp. ORNL1]|uniref:transposase n=1 Tax=Roseimicrobium sp. ORNL1 TaxID=2711231 RepID=UPI0013E12EAA|nr:transposase [Roseimicrobium sp. ORNL1]QIF00763.1 hypothetical protein G5S37_04235 [Roseimicrobium sp. ORNL1]
MKEEDLVYFNPFANTEKSANRLPHWNQPSATYFITYRLSDAVPASLRRQWLEERKIWLNHHPKPWDAKTEREYHLRFSARIDAWLDAGHGECLLRDFARRRLVQEVITKFDGERYVHHAWVLMPNHVHILATVHVDISLKELIGPWKGTSTWAINRLMQRSGKLWQDDYFDRLVRDGDHFASCVRYIRRNPEKAKLREGEYTLYESDLAKLFAERR